MSVNSEDLPGESRVSEVRVQLRLPSDLAGDATPIRTQIERTLVVAVLQDLERQLQAALGAAAILHVRHVAVRWQLAVDALGDDAVIASLAAALARDLLTELGTTSDAEHLRPSSAIAVIFADRHHATAAWLADLADGLGGRWFHAGSPDAASTWAELIADGAPALSSVLTWIDRMGRRDAVLSQAPEAVLTAVASLDSQGASAVALLRARREVAGRGHTLAAQGDTITSAAASVEMASTAMIAARADLAPSPLHPGTAMPATPWTEAHAAGGAPAMAHSLSPSPPPRTAVPGSTAIASRHLARGLPGDDGGPAHAETEHPRHHAAVVHTDQAGLFYLIGRVLEIDLAESLWAAGVAEGPLLAQVARAILAGAGGPEEPAWQWFGGGFATTPAIAVVPTWAAAEITETIQHALGRRLLRFNVATTPVQLASELDALAAELPPESLLDPTTAAVVRRGAAALAVIAAARLGRRASWPALRAVIARPGALVLGADAVTVILPVEAIDLEHRRAGLDQNPGRAPWLGRQVVIQFSAAETM